METNTRDTRETVEDEYHYAVFDVLCDKYQLGLISLDGLKKMYSLRTGIKDGDKTA